MYEREGRRPGSSRPSSAWIRRISCAPAFSSPCSCRYSRMSCFFLLTTVAPGRPMTLAAGRPGTGMGCGPWLICSFDVARRRAAKNGGLPAVARHVALMLLQGIGEYVSTAVVADEVEALARRGIQGGANRDEARRADRSGRQAGVQIGVVRRVGSQFAAGNGTAGPRDGATDEAVGVDHGRVAFQQYVPFQAARKDAGDDGTFGGVGRLLFHQRG